MDADYGMADEAMTDDMMMDGENTPAEQHPADLLRSYIGVANIIDLIDREQVQKIGMEVTRGYDIDKASRADWEKQMQTAMDLAMQVASEKSWPWPKAANVKYPLITTAAIQFSARAYPAIVKGAEVVKGQVIGPDPDGQKMDRADRIGHHMSYQLLEEVKDWDEDEDKLLLQMSIVGCAFRKTYFDTMMGRPCSDLVAAKDVVYNHATPFNKLRRITHCLYLFKNEVIERQRGDLFDADLTLGLPEGEDSDEDGHFEFLEQHCWYDLDGDGYKEPYIVTVLKETSEVARIIARYDEDGIYLNARGEITRIVPVEYFTKFAFMPNPDGGSYDVGLGMLLNPINETVNTVLNQLLDAGTLANTGGGFLGAGLKMKGGAARFVPGEFKPVDSSGGKIADNIYHMQFPGPNAVLFNLLGMLIEAGKDISSVKDILTGDQQVNQTATTTLALIEQGQKVFSAIYKRVHRSLKQEFKKLYRLNKLYLQPEDYYRFQDRQEKIYLEDYQGDGTDVAPVSDPTLVSDAQELTRAEALMKFVGDPLINQIELRKKYLKALKEQDIETLMDTSKNPPPPIDPAQAQKMQQEMQAKGEELAQQEQAMTEQITAAQQSMADEIRKAQDELSAREQQLAMDAQDVQREIEKLAAAKKELALLEQMAIQKIEGVSVRSELDPREKAELDAKVAIEKAQLEQQTKLQIAQMNIKADAQINELRLAADMAKPQPGQADDAPEDVEPEVKTITITGPSGATYTGTISNGSIGINAPSGTYAGTIK